MYTKQKNVKFHVTFKSFYFYLQLTNKNLVKF